MRQAVATLPEAPAGLPAVHAQDHILHKEKITVEREAHLTGTALLLIYFAPRRQNSRLR